MIRTAKQEDSTNLAALSIQVWLHTYAIDGIRIEISEFVMSNFTMKHFENLVSSPMRRTLVYILEDHLVGYIMINLESYWQDKSNGFEIEKFYIQEHFQGKGIGRKLLSEVSNLFGCSYWLSVWVHNVKAIEFYKHFGFRDSGRVEFVLGNESHENRVLVYKRI
ncbi:MAG: GNAT family N-acetyltransferase [Candidatus Marinimicrobia bacterium]|nr:GNAT family N-acetyltransferase [Candidatus Neomarinimicrobiota bacterium]